jgi:hypothetical protein
MFCPVHSFAALLLLAVPSTVLLQLNDVRSGDTAKGEQLVVVAWVIMGTGDW